MTSALWTPRRSQRRSSLSTSGAIGRAKRCTAESSKDCRGAAFRTWHYPDWFRILIGVVEMASAVLVLIPRAAFVGGLLIAAVMLGGMGTHVYWGRPGQMTSEILPLLLGTLVALGRRRLFFSSWTRPGEPG